MTTIAPNEFTASQVLAIGGLEWTVPGKHRVYVPEDIWHGLVGLEIHTYKTGNVSYAALDGKAISNGLGAKYRLGKVYWEAGKICTQGVHEDLTDLVYSRICEAIEAAEVTE